VGHSAATPVFLLADLALLAGANVLALFMSIVVPKCTHAAPLSLSLTLYRLCGRPRPTPLGAARTTVPVVDLHRVEP
jgi:hypothetical protein